MPGIEDFLVGNPPASSSHLLPTSIIGNPSRPPFTCKYWSEIEMGIPQDKLQKSFSSVGNYSMDRPDVQITKLLKLRLRWDIQRCFNLENNKKNNVCSSFYQTLWVLRQNAVNQKINLKRFLWKIGQNWLSCKHCLRGITS